MTTSTIQVKDLHIGMDPNLAAANQGKIEKTGCNKVIRVVKLEDLCKIQTGIFLSVNICFCDDR